jgi:RNA polymerase sigma factor (sigma-70 family)
MSSPSGFSEMRRRLEAGSESVAAEVVARFAGRLAALVRGRLAPQLRGALSASDVVQEALHSFFRQERERPFALAGEEGLWSLLVRITLNKQSKMVRDLTRLKRGEGKVGPLPEEGSEALPADDGPTPEEAAVCADAVRRLLEGLGETDQALCLLLLDGCSGREVAARLNVTEVTVSRKRARLKERLRRLLEA